MSDQASQEHPALREVRARFAIIADLSQAADLLSWDQNTYMPSGAAEARGQQLATLKGVVHARLADARLGELLDQLERAGLPEDSVDAALVRQARRKVARARKLPEAFVEALTRQASRARQVWAEARAQNAYRLFAPELERLLELKRREADYLGFEAHPYDALHDEFEPGSSASSLRAVFGPLRERAVAMLAAIREQAAPADDVLRQVFDEGKQEQFGLEVVRGFGYDLQHGRLDRALHPFAQALSKYDVRITTRYKLRYLNTALFGCMHEAGHALYEQGIHDAFQRTPLGETISLGVHESQSRLWENLVGRSYAFWQGSYPRLQELFPAQLGEVPLDEFYAAINRVEPSLIRVEADEVSYNLHVMIRFELELALLEGTLAVAELPEAWNAKYQAYLGLVPPTDSEGCLQDIHWSVGLFGYFPTYTLGNVMSVQLFEAARAALPGLEDELRRGEFGALLGWLREHVHRHGSRYLPDELLRRATGSPLEAGPYLRYLQRKFGALYDLGELA